MTNAEINKLEEVVDAMGYDEKVVAVRCIDTEVLLGEITRRLITYKEQNERFKDLITCMERH